MPTTDEERDDDEKQEAGAEIYFRLPSELKQAAKDRADEQERTLSGYLRNLIKNDTESQ